MKYFFKNIRRVILPVVALGLSGFNGISSAQNTRPPIDVAVGDILPQAGLRTSDGGVLLSRTRTLDSRPDYEVYPTNLELSKHGGWKARRVAATGFTGTRATYRGV